MLTTRFTQFSAAITLITVIASGYIPGAIAQTILPASRISVSPNGAGGNGSSTNANISPNGRFTVFRSSANNLVSGDTNGTADVFIRDNNVGSISRVSVNSSNIEANGESTLPVVSPVSPNGFYAIAYESLATNLPLFSATLPDTNNVKDVYINVPTLGFTERVSIGINSKIANNESREPSITITSQPETALVAFTSDASNLVATDTNGFSDIFLATLIPSSNAQQFFSGALSIIRVSEGTGGVQSNGKSSKPAISGDGRFVVYQSEATNLFTVTGIPSASQIYVYDIAKKTTTLVSRTASGAPGNGASFSPSISYSGTFITYLTEATNIVADGQTPKSGSLQSMRFNVATGTTERVNVSSGGQLSDSSTSTSVNCRIAPNGRTVLFTDAGSNLFGTDSNNNPDVFLRDMSAGSTVRLSNSASGSSADNSSFDPTLGGSSYAGLTLNSAFTSFATNIIVGDTEGRTDVFAANATLAPQTFARALPLETPPDVTLGAGRSLAIGLTALKKPPTVRATSKKKPEIRVQYRVTLTRLTAARTDVRRKVSNRNVVTFGKLPPGTYSVVYRAETTRNGKLSAATKLSATQQVVIQ